MVGGNDPEMAKVVFDTLTKNAKGATIYELSNDEMQMVTNSRMNKANADTMQEYMENEENKNQAKVIAMEFYNRFFKEIEKGLFLEAKFIKNQTTFSWSKFNEVMATLDMFGFVEWQDEKKKFIRIVVDEEDIYENKKRETQAMLDLCKGKLIELQGLTPTKKDKDKLETMKKRMTLTI